MRRFAIAFAVVLCAFVGGFGLPGAAAAPPERPAWTEAVLPRALFVARIDSNTFRDVADAFSRRVGVEREDYLLPADDPAAAVLGAMLHGELEDAIEGRHDSLKRLRFEHLDGERPLVMMLGPDRPDPLAEPLSRGLPPTDAEWLEPRMLVRLVVPSGDPEALVAETDAWCADDTTIGCRRVYRTRRTDGHVWFDFAIRHDHPIAEDYTFETDPDYLRRATPAARAFLTEASGLSVYFKSNAPLRIALFERIDDLTRDLDAIDRADADERPYEIRQTRREIAEAMIVSDLATPSTREVEDVALIARGDGRQGVALDAIQSYSALGRQVARAGGTELAVPRLEMPRPIVTGSWRFDLKGALGAARAPAWLTDPLTEPGMLGGAYSTVSRTGGFNVTHALMTAPVGGLAGLLEALPDRSFGSFGRPVRYLELLGGSLAIDFDPVAMMRGGLGLKGGIALAVGSTEAAEAYQALASGMGASLNTPIDIDVQQREGPPVVGLRVDTDRTFTAGEASATRHLSLQANLDRLRAKLEVLGEENPPGIDNDIYEMMAVLEGASVRLHGNRVARGGRLSMGGGDIPAVELPETTAEPLQVDRPAACLTEVRRASKRLYVRHVDTGPYYPRREVRAYRSRLSTRSAPPVEQPVPARLKEDVRRRIELFVDRYEEAECDGAAEVVGYWQAVLDGESGTYPGARKD